MKLQYFSCQSILFVCLTVFTLFLSSGCSDGSDNVSVEQVPTADLSEALSGGNGPFIGAAVPAQLEQFGYIEEEYVAAGTAFSYHPTTPQTEDGRWSFEPDDSADYRTRILVRRPENPADFSGSVIVEWLNVSGGVDANAEWVQLEEELTRRGHVWVGVSAQLIGVEGGPVLVTAPGGEGKAGVGLKKLDPARYASLSHPGDGYSFDIFTQVAPGEYADLINALGTVAVRIRTDLGEPVMNIQAESDITGAFNSIRARQPDGDTFRLWEVAGTAHADMRLVGPTTAEAMNCGLPINDGPQHFVAKAAFSSLDNWVRTGVAPRAAHRLEVTSANPPAMQRDADGIALGGVRTPLVDVPVDVLSGVAGPNPDVICILSGSTAPLPEARLAELYASRDDYVQRYAASTDAAIEAGFVLDADREALIAESDPASVSN